MTSPQPGSDPTTAPTSGPETAGLDPGAVLGWGMPRLRDLPWRRVRDPWQILVAEVMLQQTQVSRVVPKWEAFLQRYPTPAACASSSLGDLLRVWRGLGYPRRARDLHATATRVVTEHGGTLPADLASLLALPGIGPYTARAVLAFAFEQDVAVVETNIARVLARTSGRRLTQREVQRVADDLVPARAGWAWNQALMDLGATVCRPAPVCPSCPVAGTCGWNRAGRVAPDPAAGSAGVSGPQAPYEGSDRQARGRVLAALNAGARPRSSFPPDVIASLLVDGLVTVDGDELRLP